MGIHCVFPFLVKGDVIIITLPTTAGRQFKVRNLCKSDTDYKSIRVSAIAYFSLSMLVPSIFIVMLRMTPPEEVRMEKRAEGMTKVRTSYKEK